MSTTESARTASGDPADGTGPGGAPGLHVVPSPAAPTGAGAAAGTDAGAGTTPPAGAPAGPPSGLPVAQPVVPPPLPPGGPAGGPAGGAPSGRLGGRLLRGGLLAAAVAAVVALESGPVPMPFDEPVTSAAKQGLTGPGTAGAKTAGAPFDARNAAVDALLATMTKAYAAGDEKAFLSTVDPTKARTVAALRTVYRNLRAIGYDQVAFTWPSRVTYQPANQDDYADPTAKLPPIVSAVEVRTRLGGFDPAPSVDVVGWTFAQRGGRWVLAGTGDRDSFFADWANSQPWMLGTVSVVRTPHTVVVGDPARKAQLKRLAARLEASTAAVRKVWKVRSWNGKVVAYASADKRFVKYWFDGQEATGKVTKEAKFDAKVVTLSRTADLTGAEGAANTGSGASTPRMIVTPYLLGRDDAESRAVLTHELTHVAFAREGRDSTPVWLAEGVAEYTGYRRGGSAVDGVGSLAARGLPPATWTQLKRGTWKPALVADADDFYTGSSAHVGDTYTTAWLTCLYVADTYGEQSLAKLYAAAATATDDEDPEQVESRILRTVLKTDRRKLLAGTTSYAKRIRSRFV